ncbi:Lipoyl synthase, chloroplastic [Dionaea muscipula]
MMQTITTQVAQHLCSSVSFHLKQINPLIEIDLAVLMRLVTTAPSPGDASSTPNHQSSVGLNRDSSIGANKTHSEKAPQGHKYMEVKDSLSPLNLHTVCEEAQCPTLERHSA